MSDILIDMDGVICHIDDVLTHGQDQESRDQRIREVLRRLQAAGLTLNNK